ncbi:MAG: hypothetical protein R3Y68_06180 [Rikenellaceae bacterium]
MTLRDIIYIAIIAATTVACQEMPHRLDNRRIVATVGDKSLQLGELSSALPVGLCGDDSLAFVSQYVDRWIARQIKVNEAERIFSSSVSEVEAMVASYRNALLTRKLDQYYLNSSTEHPFSDGDVRDYYRNNMNSFRLDHTIAKGLIILLPRSYEEVDSIEKLLDSKREEDRLNLLSLCERIDGAEIREFSSWSKYDDFLAVLPIGSASGSRQYLYHSGSKRLTDESYNYLFRVEAYRSEGYVAPLEIATPAIKKILTAQHQQAIIRRNEERLYRDAERNNSIRVLIDRAPKEEIVEQVDAAETTEFVGADN